MGGVRSEAELWAACAAISFWVEASARVSAVEAAPSPAPSARASSSASLSLSLLVSGDGVLSEEAAATAPTFDSFSMLTNQVDSFRRFPDSFRHTHPRTDKSNKPDHESHSSSPPSLISLLAPRTTAQVPPPCSLSSHHGLQLKSPRPALSPLTTDYSSSPPTLLSLLTPRTTAQVPPPPPCSLSSHPVSVHWAEVHGVGGRVGSVGGGEGDGVLSSLSRPAGGLGARHLGAHHHRHRLVAVISLDAQLADVVTLRREEAREGAGERERERAERKEREEGEC